MPLQTSWDAFERIFDEAFSRSKNRPFSPSSPDLISPLQSPQFPTYTRANAGRTPFGATYPRGFSYSDESLGTSAIHERYPQDEDDDDPFDTTWKGKTRRSTVTTTKSVKRLALPKSGLKLDFGGSVGSNSTSTSSGPLASPTSPVPPPTSSSPPAREGAKSPTPKTIRRKKSKVTFQDSADGKMVTATFDLQDVKKSDVHVSYQNDKVVISWESVTTDERTEGERVIRERREKKYVRTLPLPDATKFEEVKASMDGRRLIVTYPKFMVRASSPVQVIEIKSD